MVKKIHYCWFGGNKLPKDVKKCINTWKKMLPDYEIIEWNETNFDINSCEFVKKAYENKKWAFVSDYVRIYALYEQGGIYFDTDMKVIKDVSKIVDKEMFLGYEDTGYVGTAVIGVKEKHNKYIKEILDFYNKIDHFNVELIYNYANPVIITRMINQYDSYENEDGIRIFDNNIYVYPRDYFFPLSYNYSERVFTQNTCMVHLFNATWTDRGERRTIGIYRKFGPEAGKVINRWIDKLFNFKGYVVGKLKGLYNFARMKYSIHFNRNKRLKNIKSQLDNKKEDYIVITHPEMVQEKETAENLFKENILEIREQYTKKEAKAIAKILATSGKKLIIFNSYIDGWDNIMTELKNINRKIQVKILVYGGVALLADENKWNSLNTIVDLYYKRSIDELGFFNKELYEFHKQKGYKTSYLMKLINIPNIENYKNNKQSKNYTKIGLYNAYDNFTKNIYNQIFAVGLLENVMLDCAPINYKISMIARKYNINLCGESRSLIKEELYKKVADNDINLYITSIEETEILPLESLELGTICLTSNNYSYFMGTELEKYLIVQKSDSIEEINNHIKYALQNKETILQIYDKMKEKYTKEAIDKITQFLSI